VTGEERIFPGQGDWPDGVFDGVGIDLDAAVWVPDITSALSIGAVTPTVLNPS